MVDTLKKEQELKEAAIEARKKKIMMSVSNISSVNTTKTEETEILLGKKKKLPTDNQLEADIIERNNLRNLRKKEIERDRRIELIGHRKGKNNKEVKRDISEQIALGSAQPTSKESMIDSRLYNQVTGLESVSLIFIFLGFQRR